MPQDLKQLNQTRFLGEVADTKVSCEVASVLC